MEQLCAFTLPVWVSMENTKHGHHKTFKGIFTASATEMIQGNGGAKITGDMEENQTAGCGFILPSTPASPNSRQPDLSGH